MIETEVKTVEQTVVTALVCDCCKQRIEAEDVTSFQEAVRFRFVGGYGSAFGDGNSWECDLCDACCVKLFEPFMRLASEPNSESS